MKNLIITISTLFSITALASTAQAHEPEQHMKDAEKPNCAAMKDMDHSKMDMNDPVMQAMMKQCMESMHADDEASETPADDQDEHMKHDAPPKDDETAATPDDNHHEKTEASEDKPGAEHSH